MWEVIQNNFTRILWEEFFSPILEIQMLRMFVGGYALEVPPRSKTSIERVDRSMDGLVGEMKFWRPVRRSSTSRYCSSYTSSQPSALILITPFYWHGILMTSLRLPRCFQGAELCPWFWDCWESAGMRHLLPVISRVRDLPRLRAFMGRVG